MRGALIRSKAPSLAPLILLLCPTQWPLMPLCGNVCYDGWGRLTPTGRMLNCRMGTKWGRTMATGYSTPSFALRHQQSRPATAAPDEFRVINNFQRQRFLGAGHHWMHRGSHSIQTDGDSDILERGDEIPWKILILKGVEWDAMKVKNSLILLSFHHI